MGKQHTRSGWLYLIPVPGSFCFWKIEFWKSIFDFWVQKMMCFDFGFGFLKSIFDFRKVCFSHLDSKIVFWFQEYFCSTSFSKYILEFQIGFRILEIADPLLSENDIDVECGFSTICFSFWFQKIVYFVFGFRFVGKSDFENRFLFFHFWFLKNLYFVFGFGFRKLIFVFWFQKILDFVFRKWYLGFWFHRFLYELFLQVNSEFWKRFSYRSFASFE